MPWLHRPTWADQKKADKTIRGLKLTTTKHDIHHGAPSSSWKKAETFLFQFSRMDDIHRVVLIDEKCHCFPLHGPHRRRPTSICMGNEITCSNIHEAVRSEQKNLLGKLISQEKGCERLVFAASRDSVQQSIRLIAYRALICRPNWWLSEMAGEMCSNPIDIYVSSVT